MPVTRNLSMLPTTTNHSSIYSTTFDKDDRIYRSITTRHCPPSPPNTSHPSTPLMASATVPLSSSRRASYYYTSPSRPMALSTSSSPTITYHSSIPSPKMSKQDEGAVANGVSAGPSPFFNLEKVVHQYGEQRDLLELILSSKVEEDRRRAEEAKLRQKEIDYLLQQHRYGSDSTMHDSHKQQKKPSSRSNSISRPPSLSIDKSIHNSGWDAHSTSQRRSSNVTSNSSIDNSSTSILPRIRSPQIHQYPTSRDSAATNSSEMVESWRNSSSLDQPARHQKQQKQLQESSPQREHRTERRNSTNNIDSLLSHSPKKSVSAVLPPISTSTSTSPIISHHHHPSSAFNIPSISHVTSPRADSSSSNRSNTPESALSPIDADGDSCMAHTTERLPSFAGHYHPHQIEPRQVYQPMLPSFPPPDKLPILPATSHRIQRPAIRRRRRREMQAISTIIETREFPYNDDYLWKNNGNTVHKKSGFRSIYYKCSNSAKGCPVNKTVTFKEHGNYLIKYRGEHLDECNRIKRIVDV
ncbi:hypothetical protein BDA99DRAFT_540975 [Phascolomyces articulosus]|uniref:WRKY domain-containing protein n=1 Tax=Phascolomyces articulosus TaxID=60185 RepID=A0AAD5JTH6_9FUNG|nr:hypothetical protein BDA99DRAFT_540975 [Phascolomyces articulosus]